MHIIIYVTSYKCFCSCFMCAFSIILQLKTVMERCEKGKPELLDRVRSMRTKSGYTERLTAEKNFCVPLSLTTVQDPAMDLKSQLTQAQLEKYSRAYDDSPHVSILYTYNITYSGITLHTYILNGFLTLFYFIFRSEKQTSTQAVLMVATARCPVT